MDTITVTKVRELVAAHPTGLASLLPLSSEPLYESRDLWRALRGKDRAYIFREEPTRFSIEIEGTRHAWRVIPG